MDITSFSLGISFTLVVGMLAVTFYNLFRVYKINKEIQSLHEMFTSDIRRTFSVIEENKMIAAKDNDTIWSELRRTISNTDSRIDKLIDKVDRSRDDEHTERLSSKYKERLKGIQKELLND